MQTVDDIVRKFRDLYRSGTFVRDKSGVRTVELIGESFVADRPSIFGEVKQDYVNRELEWYLSMSLNVNDIPGRVPEIWRSVATPDGFINSNYGWCIFSKENGMQYQRALEAILKRPDTRQAVMIYTRPSMHDDSTRGGMSDFMCTNAVQFLLRGDRLHCVVQMRSNDAVFGYKNDRAWHAYVLDRMVIDLNDRADPVDEIKAGDILWNAGSLHVYERHFPFIEAAPR